MTYGEFYKFNPCRDVACRARFRCGVPHPLESILIYEVPIYEKKDTTKKIQQIFISQQESLLFFFRVFPPQNQL